MHFLLGKAIDKPAHRYNSENSEHNTKGALRDVFVMVLISDGNSEHVAQV